MVSKYSVYAVNQAKPPEWLPGEELAATAFIAMTIVLVIEINVEIQRTFKRRKGIYYWAARFGSVGCFLDTVSLILRYLVPNPQLVWPLYTLLATAGWAVFTLAQLTVLYSRLHLVCRNENIQRQVFYIIVVVSPILIIADWITIWPAYNPDPKVTDRWSAPAAIVERIAQLGFSIVEVVINAIYIVSLIRLLKLKSNVRQRRVMVDLIYVVVIATTFDILNIILVYFNRTGISHPIQTFSYALKLRLEFTVLNQLMAVAARGILKERETFADKRYHYPESVDDCPTSKSLKGQDKNDLENMDLRPSIVTTDNDSIQATAPTRAILKSSNPADARGARDDDLQQHRRSSPGEESTWYFPHIKTPLHNPFPRYSHPRRSSDKCEIVPIKVKRRENGLRSNDQDEPEEETIDIYEWERNAQHILVVPWFRESTGDA